MSRRQFDRQLKIGAVKMLQQSGDRRSEAANCRGVTSSRISGWIKEFEHLDEVKPYAGGG